MKAIILCHDGNHSVVMDRDGDFHLVQGYTEKQTGTEIDMEASAAACYALYVIPLPTKSGSLSPTRVYIKQSLMRDKRLR